MWQYLAFFVGKEFSGRQQGLAQVVGGVWAALRVAKTPGAHVGFHCFPREPGEGGAMSVPVVSHPARPLGSIGAGCVGSGGVPHRATPSSPPPPPPLIR
ncbi:hypothetical protein CesoFtcFv8_003476 [Champsocephalus esox]|uniref:Uncharacterized protein n=1 Tax=Champsocephalus esox TaxID=159716 RepID=A0AAN8CSR9_9TELE|nr:hypothetical protein CesoFtcFv8_003476 [Champsocephalus esox]